MEEALRNLLSRLEQIGKDREEIYDTECRERMGDAIFDGFIRTVDGFELPSDFGLYTSDSNAAVRDALATYITEANERATALQLSSFHERLAAFQNLAVKSNDGQYYDDFFGYCDPKAFNDAGVLIEDYWKRKKGT